MRGEVAAWRRAQGLQPVPPCLIKLAALGRIRPCRVTEPRGAGDGSRNSGFSDTSNKPALALGARKRAKHARAFGLGIAPRNRRTLLETRIDP